MSVKQEVTKPQSLQFRAILGIDEDVDETAYFSKRRAYEAMYSLSSG